MLERLRETAFPLIHFEQLLVSLSQFLVPGAGEVSRFPAARVASSKRPASA